MTNEEAIEAFLPIVDNEAYTDGFQDACRLAIQALEKQIPKKPDEEVYYVRMSGAENEAYECPVCGGFLAYKVDAQEEYYQSNYCGGCGQALKWGVE